MNSPRGARPLCLLLLSAALLGACGDKSGTPGLFRDGPAPIRVPVFEAIADAILFSESYTFMPSNASTAGVLMNCAIASNSATAALPATLSLAVASGARACAISGTLDNSGAPTASSYTITATNSAGTSQPLTFTMVFGLTAPILAQAPVTAAPELMRQITPIVFPNTGGPLRVGEVSSSTPCSVSPSLPAGLTVGLTNDGASCQISGTPTGETETVSRTYMVTATNPAGTVAAMTTFAVASPPPTMPILVDRGAIDLALGDSNFTGITFVNNGADVTSCAQTGLPMGLGVAPVSFGSKMTCAITGLPAEATSSSVQVTITGTSAASQSDSATAIITVFAPPVIMPLGTVTLILRRSISSDSAVVFPAPVAGGIVRTCSVGVDDQGQARQLPSGLVLRAFRNTCRIDGTPRGSSIMDEEYDIIARNPAGTSTVSLVLTIQEAGGDPPMIDDLTTTSVFLVNQHIASRPVFPATGGAVIACVFGTPRPPAEFGVTLLGNTCTIFSIVPLTTTTNGVETFTVIASNGAAMTDSATIPINVREALDTDPGIMDIAGTQPFTVGQSVRLVFESSSASPSVDNCVVSGGVLPRSLRITVVDNKCEILGTAEEVTLGANDRPEARVITVWATGGMVTEAASVRIRITPATSANGIIP